MLNRYEKADEEYEKNVPLTDTGNGPGQNKPHWLTWGQKCRTRVVQLIVNNSSAALHFTLVHSWAVWSVVWREGCVLNCERSACVNVSLLGRPCVHTQIRQATDWTHSPRRETASRPPSTFPRYRGYVATGNPIRPTCLPKSSWARALKLSAATLSLCW